MHRLIEPGVPVEFHLRPLVPHAFEPSLPLPTCRAMFWAIGTISPAHHQQNLTGYRQIEGPDPHTSRCSVNEALTDLAIPAGPAFTWSVRRRSTCNDVVMFRRSALRYLVVVHDLQAICTH